MGGEAYTATKGWVFRRPWKTWRRDRRAPTFVIPPAPGPAATFDTAVFGYRKIIAPAGDSSRRWVFRRPWGRYGSYPGIIVRQSSSDYNQSTMWPAVFQQFGQPMSRFGVKRNLPAGIQKEWGYVEARTQNAKQAGVTTEGNFDFGEEIQLSKWFAPLSEPVQRKVKPQLLAGQQRYDWLYPWPDINIGWFVDFTQPAGRFVRRKLPEPLQREQWQPHWPDINIAWWRNFDQPASRFMVRPKLPEGSQREFWLWFPPEGTYVNLGWYADFTQPMGRFVKPHLSRAIQRFDMKDPAPAPGKFFVRVYIIT